MRVAPWRGLRRFVDLQRSLFDPPALVAPAVEVPVAPDRPAPTAPAAEHVIDLDGRRVAYRLKRSRRRSIGFVVGDAGLVVTAPLRAARRDIDAALVEKRRWILKRLAEHAERAARVAAARIEWRDGMTLAYLGSPLRVVLDPGLGERGEAGPVVAATAQPATLCLGLPHDVDPRRLRDALRAWLERQARLRFAARCRDFEPRLGVRATRLTLSSAATRWGSAHASGAIRLHWRLIQLAPETIDYVVAHELAHLREMNHGPRFWRAVRSVVADCDAARRALRGVELPAWE